MKNYMSAIGGKKILLAVSIITLIAAGCGKTDQSGQENTQTPTQQPSATSTGNATTSAPHEGVNPSTGSSWQGILQKSDTSAKGNYMISVNGHMLYLRTSRDYSQLVGKKVNVNYSGDIMNFSLVDITAQ